MKNINLECRLCNNEVQEIINLGDSPVANTFINTLEDSFKLYPLQIDFCKKCYNVQLRNCIEEEYLYQNYSYMTPNIEVLNKHYLEIIYYLKNNGYINSNTKAIEIGSNTGYFLNFLEDYVSKIIGIDPAKNIAQIANSNGNFTINEFFNSQSALKIRNQFGTQDIIIARHMFAHNTYPQKILEGMEILLSNDGIIVIENAYAIPTFLRGEFDQIYHEHKYYYSLLSINNLLNKFSFEVIDIKESSIHGGSITFIASRKNNYKRSAKINTYVENEINEFLNLKIFKIFDLKINNLKKNILHEINKDFSKGKIIASYGASAKAFTMFSFLKLDNKMISYCIDTTPTKIGKYFPFFNIPIVSEKQHLDFKADTYLLTAWNYKNHILEKKEKLFKKGDKLIVPLPEFEVYVI